jgi:hypothetical protein
MTAKARRAALSATLLAAGLSLSGAVNAAFISGVWQGDANFDSQGRFSDCTMTAQASSGLLIGFIISKRYEWGLVVADERQRFALGSTEIVALHIDKRDPIQAIAKVVDIHGIVIPLENSASVLEGFREGNALTVVGEKLKISIKLTGTRAAIAALALASPRISRARRWTRNRGAPSGSRRLRDQRRENSFSISASLSSI